MKLEFDASPEDLRIFLDEADEQIALLDRSILILERESSQDLLQGIFRAAHTLKGSSATLGHTRMAELTHGLESVLDQLRKGDLTVTPELIDGLLAGLDALRVLREEVVTGETDDFEVHPVVDRLHGLSLGQVQKSVSPKRSNLADAMAAAAVSVDSAASAYRLDVQLQKDCLFPAVRAFQVLTELRGIGNVIWSDPSENDINNEKVDRTISVVVTSQEPVAGYANKLLAAAKSVLDVTSATVFPYTSQGQAAPQVGPVSIESSLVAFRVNAQLEKDCQFPAVRAFQILAELRAVGSIVWSDPTEDEVVDEKVDRSLSVVVTAPPPAEGFADRLHAAAVSVLDVVSAVVLPSESPKTSFSGDSHEEPKFETVFPLRGEAEGPTPPVQDKRIIDLGPEARGANNDDKLKLASQKMTRMSKTIRFDVEKLDDLMNLVGELVIERARMMQVASSIEDEFGDGQSVTELREASVRMGRITDELQQKTMQARMLPIENVFSRFPRMIRDLSRRAEKEVEFIIEGQETELDRTVIEEIGDPLIHLLRNAVDHAIEPPEERVELGKPRAGTVRLAANLSDSENEIILEVEDDGRGIDVVRLRNKAVERGLLSREQADRMSDREAVDLVFAAGLSTAEKVTDISGRGVGMDIVRANIEKVNGSIAVSTQLGVGTKVTIRVPLTLAIIPTLLVAVGDAVCALPINQVMETLRVTADDIQTIRGAEAVQLRDTILPLLRLRTVFGLPPSEAEKDRSHRGFVVAVRWGERIVGFVVDNLIGGQDIVIKPLGRVVGNVEGLSGAMILGDGRVGLVLDVPGLVKRALRNQSRVA